jgi:hypothetical protein
MRAVWALAALAICWPLSSSAKPIGPTVFCDVYPDAPVCIGGKPACVLCHTSPPERNAFGTAVAAALLPGTARPLSDQQYTEGLPAALQAVEAQDADADGFTNGDEILAGTEPANERSKPVTSGCPPFARNPYYDVCFYDRAYVLKKLHLDFCGRSPTPEELDAFRAMSEQQQDGELDAALDRCLRSEYWTGKDGALWRLAHRKIRPLQAIKSGSGSGIIPLADYWDDYNLYVFTHTGDRDVREVLTASYFVSRNDPAPGSGEATSYNLEPDVQSQTVDRERRAGLLTTRWYLVFNVMFTPLPRTAAAQAYRAFLNLDIARLEGLQPVQGEPVDYDQRGVTYEACVICHSTLDPLSYPFRNYDGLNDFPFGRYQPGRIEQYYSDVAPNITSMPEEGVILGQRVANLVEWARVAADSDPFAAAVVEDFWRLLNGEGPTAEENEEFVQLWRDLKTTHNYRVERMLHALIKTEAYGVP